MSASSTPIMVKKQSTEMKLVHTKDNRLTPSKSPSDNRVTKIIKTSPSVPKSVIREPPPKQESDITCAKPIVIPTIPNLLSIIKGQSTLSQFFSGTLPPLSSAQPSKPRPIIPQPKKSTVHPHTYSTTSQSSKIPPTHSTAAHSTSTHSTAPQRTKPIMMHNNFSVSQKITQSTFNSNPNPFQKHQKEIPLTKKPLTPKNRKGHSKASSSLALPTGSSSKDEDTLQPPKAKKAKITNAPGLPMSRVRTIMKTHVQSNQNSVNIGQESVAVIARAAVSV